MSPFTIFPASISSGTLITESAVLVHPFAKLVSPIASKPVVVASDIMLCLLYKASRPISSKCFRTALRPITNVTAGVHGEVLFKLFLCACFKSR